MCVLFVTQKSMSETVYNSEWTNPDGSKSSSVVTLYGDTALTGMMGYYSGSKRNRLIGQYNLEKTVFDGYWVQDDSGEHCSNWVDGSQFYGRLFVKLNSSDEFEGLWSYCNEPPHLQWQGWIVQEISTEHTARKSETNEKIQTQTALNFFGYNAGSADGIFGKKTTNAITQLQYCWEAADPYAIFVQGTLEFGVLNQQQQEFLLRSHNEAMSSGLSSASCDWFKELLSANKQTSNTNFATEMNDNLCNYEGDLHDPVFYCSFENGKRVKVCETYSETGLWNSFIYSYGVIGGSPEIELTSDMTSVYFPEVVASTSIEYLKPSCKDAEGYPCETNHTMSYDFMDTKNQFVFTNKDYEYVVNTSSTLLSQDRIFDGKLVVNIIDKNLPAYHPNYRTAATSLDCDIGSAFNTVWDGSYVDTIIISEGLCFLDLGEEGTGWEQCLP